MLLYPFSSGYSVWSGDMPESNPGDAPSGTPVYPSDSAVTLPIGTSTSATVVIPVYPLALKVVSGSTVPTATETDGAGYPYSLKPLSGGVSSTGMPLGQYHITATGMTAALYVWITPIGTCSSPTQLTAPCPSPVATQITVTE
jgi:hypothetical protein